MTVRDQRTVIPAQPGWSVATYCKASDGKEHRFAYQPIIAWFWHTLVGGEELAIPKPLTVNGLPPASASKWAIHFPDGRFESPGHRTCKDEAEALALYEEYERWAKKDHARWEQEQRLKAAGA